MCTLSKEAFIMSARRVASLRDGYMTLLVCCAEDPVEGTTPGLLSAILFPVIALLGRDLELRPFLFPIAKQKPRIFLHMLIQCLAVSGNGIL
jgi:hypothetical protein